jgi:hypothetical protein
VQSQNKFENPLEIYKEICENGQSAQEAFGNVQIWALAAFAKSSVSYLAAF